MNNITIELTEDEARLFRLFMQYHNEFEFMLKGEVFATERGNVTLNFSPQGELCSIERHLFVYNK